MKTIKIIDLLNKIANGEEIPKKIKHAGAIFEYYERLEGVFNYREIVDGEYVDNYLNDSYFIENILNDEVEIIEEENKLPEKLEEIGKIDYNLGYIDYKNIEVLKTWLNSDMSTIFNELDLIVKNQNQLIDYLESKEKGE